MRQSFSERGNRFELREGLFRLYGEIQQRMTYLPPPQVCLTSVGEPHTFPIPSCDTGSRTMEMVEMAQSFIGKQSYRPRLITYSGGPLEARTEAAEDTARSRANVFGFCFLVRRILK